MEIGMSGRTGKFENVRNKNLSTFTTANTLHTYLPV